MTIPEEDLERVRDEYTDADGALTVRSEVSKTSQRTGRRSIKHSDKRSIDSETEERSVK
jgi:hypothetical protein